MLRSYLYLGSALLVACGGRAEVDSQSDPVDPAPSPQPGVAPSTGTGASATELMVTGGASSSTGGTSSSSGGQATGGAGGEPGDDLLSSREEIEEFCETSCEEVPTGTGSCAEFMACGPDDQCLDKAHEWNGEERDAFAWCVENDPVCFISIEGCIMSRLLEQGPMAAAIHATGFEAMEGRDWKIHSNQDESSGVIAEGGFQEEHLVGVFDTFANSVTIWIDTNDNGICDAENDAVFFVTPEWNGELQDAAFSATVTPASSMSPGACTFF